jgi:hypothetical protein
MLSGISPDNRFPDRPRTLRFLKLPISEGRGPDSKLYDKLKYLERSGSLKISMGIEPLKRFLFMSMAYRFFSLPMLFGIGPSRLVLNTASAVSFERFPIDGGISPDK